MTKGDVTRNIAIDIFQTAEYRHFLEHGIKAFNLLSLSLILISELPAYLNQLSAAFARDFPLISSP